MISRSIKINTHLPQVIRVSPNFCTGKYDCKSICHLTFSMDARRQGTNGTQEIETN